MEKKDEIDEEMMMEPGFRGRVALSIIVGIGWLIFLIVWLAFYAQDFNVYQNIAILHLFPSYHQIKILYTLDL